MTTLALAFVPTARAIRWRPVLVVVASLVLVAVLAEATRGPISAVLAIAAAGLSSTAVAGLHDPADTLLEPLPVTRMQRRLLRLAPLAVSAAAAWWVVTEVLSPGRHQPVGPLVGLTAVGVAVAVWAPRRRAVVLGAGAPVALFVLTRVVPADTRMAEVASVWQTHPWWVLLGAVTICWLGRRR